MPVTMLTHAARRSSTSVRAIARASSSLPRVVRTIETAGMGVERIKTCTPRSKRAILARRSREDLFAALAVEQPDAPAPRSSCRAVSDPLHRLRAGARRAGWREGPGGDAEEASGVPDPRAV